MYCTVLYDMRILNLQEREYEYLFHPQIYVQYSVAALAVTVEAAVVRKMVAEEARIMNSSLSFIKNFRKISF